MFYIYSQPEILDMDINDIPLESHFKIANFDVKLHRKMEASPFSTEESDQSSYII